MKKLVTTLTLAAVLTLGASQTFAGVVISGKTGVVISGKTGVVISGKN